MRAAATVFTLTAEDVARFTSMVRRGQCTNCWPWAGPLEVKGYGIMKIGGKRIKAHRIAFLINNGSISSDLFVCHTCDNPPCCNPAHLYEGTNDDNMRDIAERGRHWSKRNPIKAAANGFRLSQVNRGLPGERNPGAKLTNAQITQIRTSKESSSEAAAAHGVSPSNIRQIRRREIWRHI